MRKLRRITLKGASGASYRFKVFPWEADFGAEGAVYFVTRRREKAPGSHWHSRILAGQTGDLSARVADHRRSLTLQSRQPNCICVHAERDETRRVAIESDLISLYCPPCNEP